MKTPPFLFHSISLITYCRLLEIRSSIFFSYFHSRSPSPEPIYSSDGKRLNTREFRTRKRLEEQRHQLVVRMQCMNPDFKPPADYK